MTATKPAAKTTKVSKVAKAPAANTTASQEPSLRFFHSKAVGKRIDGVLGALEKAPEDSKHPEAVADLVACGCGQTQQQLRTDLPVPA